MLFDMRQISLERPEQSTLSPEGRIVIPAAIRSELGLKPGDRLTFHVRDGVVTLSSREQALRRIKAKAAEYRGADPDAPSGVEELIAERRAEAAAEAATIRETTVRR